jgi:hypothetical protein
MAIIVKPKTWNASDTPNNTDLNSDFDTIYNDYNGNITDANIAAGAGIQAGKILYTALTATGPGVQSSSQVTTFTNALHRQLPYIDVLALTENLTAASATALSPLKLWHNINAAGTGTINTLTGGVEGQIAILVFSHSGVTVTASTADTPNSIHLNSFASGTAAAATSLITTNVTATAPFFKTFLFTANMPGFTNGQWFEIAGG